MPGGMMHLGIPEYRLPRDVLQAQIREILDLGPELRFNARLGRDFSLSDFAQQGYTADFARIRLASQPRLADSRQRTGRRGEGRWISF